MADILLDTFKPDEQALKIARAYSEYSRARDKALALSTEVRQYIHAVDVDTTSASNIEHKNRTHQPKITQVRDTLIAKIWNVTLSRPDWFEFKPESAKHKTAAKKLNAYIRNKLEQIQFRTTTGRKLVADFIDQGNAFVETEYRVDQDDFGTVSYKGAHPRRIAPSDMVFNPTLDSFSESPLIQRRKVHISSLYNLADSKIEGMEFNKEALKTSMMIRKMEDLTEFQDRLRDLNINYDGYGSVRDYFASDYVDLLIYRGDIFDPIADKYDTNRLVYVIDKMFILATMPNPFPLGRHGVAHAGARIRSDNLWYQSPLDNLVGIQYRIDKLENSKADMVDLIVLPPLKIKGDGVQKPAEGYRPGAEYYMGVDEDVSFLTPDVTALQMDTQIALYHRMMEDFAGVPPESRGFRSPGEKTMFEVDMLAQAGAETFVYYATNFENLLTQMLEDVKILEIKNMTSSETVEIFDEDVGAIRSVKFDKKDLMIPGKFIAIGSTHWDMKRKKNLELQNFAQTYMTIPQIAQHISGAEMAKEANDLMEFSSSKVVSEYAGLKEQIQGQAIATAEQAKAQQTLSETGVELPVGNGEQVQ